MNSSESSSDALSFVKIKTERPDHSEPTFNSFDNDDTIELFNSALIEDLNSNEKVLGDINRFIVSQREKLNKKNLVNYCGILDPSKQSFSFTWFIEFKCVI